MKKIMLIVLLVAFFTGCAKTSAPEDLRGKVDLSRPVEYVVVKDKDRAKAIYVFTGKDPEDIPAKEENQEDLDIGADKKKEKQEEKEDKKKEKPSEEKQDGQTNQDNQTQSIQILPNDTRRNDEPAEQTNNNNQNGDSQNTNNGNGENEIDGQSSSDVLP